MSDLIFKLLFAVLLLIQGGSVIACDDQRLSFGSTDIIKDGKTGLVWWNCSLGSEGVCSSAGSDSKVNFSGAQKAETSNSAQGWRLPSLIELSSLVRTDCDASNTVLGMLMNTGTAPVSFWSSSSAARSPNLAWGVDLEQGATKTTAKTTLAHGVLLVRGLVQGD